MTNKEIIMIDGVNVNECKGYYFSPTGYHSCQDISQINDLGYEQDTLCEQNPDCYFKQLARKTQECEKYKQALDKVLSIATNSDMLPCADPNTDYTKCKDKITEKGKRCMRYGLIKIKNIVEKAKGR